MPRASFALTPVIAWVLFIVLRPPNSFFLSKEQAARLSGDFFIMSGAPYTHLAERPLYTWSTWHGGERTAVKALEVATLPGLVAGCAACLPVSFFLSSYVTVQQESWVRFVFVLVFSALQWWAISAALPALRWRSRRGV
jgi:hypothetical protein